MCLGYYIVANIFILVKKAEYICYDKTSSKGKSLLSY